jgi:amino acid transporter
MVWLGYSRRVVTPGGLYGFVEAAAGRRVALVQAGLFVLSYLLYVVYTVTYIVYDLVPAVFPSATSVRPLLEIATACVLAVVALAPIRYSLGVLAVVAVGQLVLVGVLSAVAFSSLGASGHSFAPTGHPSDLIQAGANTSVLFICASLPLFLGAEVRGGSLALRRGLASGWGIAAGATVVAAVPLAAAGASLLGADLPGLAIVRAAGHSSLATVIGAGVIASVAGVIVAEFLALSRLGHSLTGRPVAWMSRGLAVILVAGSAISLANPQRIYDDLFKPSLVALWLAQLIVFAVYPLFVARNGRLMARHIAFATVASGLMLFGLWSTIVNQLGT